MGTIITVNSEDFVTYEFFSEKAYLTVLNVKDYIKQYFFEFISKDAETRLYYDSEHEFFLRSGLSFCRVIAKDKSYLKIEQESSGKNGKYKISTEKKFLQDIKPKEYITDHKLEIANGISSLFPVINIDLSSVIKTCIPILEAQISRVTYRVFMGNGFKADMKLEKIIYFKKGKKSLPVYIMKLEHASPETFRKDFIGFCENLERYFKLMVRTNETKLQMGKRVTAPPPPPAPKAKPENKGDKK